MSTHQPTTQTTPAGTAIARANGFELASPRQSATANIQAALKRNRAFAAAGGHHDAVAFPNLRLLVITCLDPRTDPAHFLHLALSDAIVIRNAGGRVTPEVINDIALISQLAENVLPHGPLFEIAVIHHTQCGTSALADDTFRHHYAQRTHTNETTLREHAVLDPATTVTHDVTRLHRTPAISPRLTISGHIYDTVTGLVQTIIPAHSSTHPTNQQAQTPQQQSQPTQPPQKPDARSSDPTHRHKTTTNPHNHPTRAR